MVLQIAEWWHTFPARKEVSSMPSTSGQPAAATLFGPVIPTENCSELLQLGLSLNLMYGSTTVLDPKHFYNSESDLVDLPI
jgi:hypothetical protein